MCVWVGCKSFPHTYALSSNDLSLACSAPVPLLLQKPWSQFQSSCGISRWYQPEANSNSIGWSHAERSRDFGLSLARDTYCGKYLLTVGCKVARVEKCTAILRKAWPHPLWVMKREEISEYLWWRPLAYNSSLSGILDAWGLILLDFFLPLSLIHSWILQAFFGKNMKQCAVDTVS